MKAKDSILCMYVGEVEGVLTGTILSKGLYILMPRYNFFYSMEDDSLEEVYRGLRPGYKLLQHYKI